MASGCGAAGPRSMPPGALLLVDVGVVAAHLVSPHHALEPGHRRASAATISGRCGVSPAEYSFITAQPA